MRAKRLRCNTLYVGLLIDVRIAYGGDDSAAGVCFEEREPMADNVEDIRLERFASFGQPWCRL